MVYIFPFRLLMALMRVFFTFVLLLQVSFGSSGDKGVSSYDEALDNFLSELFLIDDQKPSQGDVVVNFQQPVGKNLTDLAPERFFTYVNPKLLTKPLYEKMLALFDNYIQPTGSKEEITISKDNEIDLFLDEVLQTTVFNRTVAFLLAQGYLSALLPGQFRNAIRSLWFDTYSRRRKGAVKDSSPFEHVFVGEVVHRRGKRRPGGLHNWLQFYNLERMGEVDYAGYIIKRQNLAIIRYQWGDLWEPISGFMLGTSPAFDLAAYTVCFLLKPKQRANCKFHINQCAVRITNYVVQRNGKKMIGTVFPSPGKATVACRNMNKT